MQTTLAAAFAFIVGLGFGLLLHRDHATRSDIEHIRYFDARSTATEANGTDPVRSTGPIQGCGSQELAFVEGDSTVKIYLISDGKKELLHELEVKPDWFRSLWFTVFQRESENIGIVLTGRSLLRTVPLDSIPKGYENRPSLFDRNCEYDLGKVASITPYCNEHVTTYPSWKLGFETPAICYQFFSRQGRFSAARYEG